MLEPVTTARLREIAQEMEICRNESKTDDDAILRHAMAQDLRRRADAEEMTAALGQHSGPDYSLIPEMTLAAIKAWIEIGRQPGSFTSALICNDLKGAFARADAPNLAAIYHTVSWLRNNAPVGAWGDPQCLVEWPMELEKRKARGGTVADFSEAGTLVQAGGTE